MKHLILVMLLVGACAWGQKIYYGDIHKVAWDAVPAATGDVIEYEVWIKPGATGTPVLLGLTPTPTYTVSLFPLLGATRYFPGVRTKLTTDEGQTTLYSGIVWSNDADRVIVPVPFALQRPTTDAPDTITGFRRE